MDLDNEALAKVLLRAAGSTAESVLQTQGFLTPFGIAISIDDETIPYTIEFDEESDPSEHLVQIAELMLADAKTGKLAGVALAFFCQLQLPGESEKKYAIGVQVEIPGQPILIAYRLSTGDEENWTFSEEFTPLKGDQSQPLVFNNELGTETRGQKPDEGD